MRKRWNKYRPLFAKIPKPQTKIKWKVFPIIWLALKRAAMFIGAAVIISAFLSAALLHQLTSAVHDVILPDQMVLTMDLESGFDETAQNLSAFSDPFATPHLAMQDIINALDTARKDPRVKGFIAEYKGGEYSLAHIQEFHTALKRFKDSGKFTAIYSDSYGDYGAFMGYYLASAFDHIWMQPLGIVIFNGLKAESPYIRTMLDKIGVLPEFIQFKKYKTANEFLTRSNMSEENKTMLRGLLKQAQEGMIKDIASNRNIEPEKLQTYINQALFTSDRALNADLITQASYKDDFQEFIKRQTFSNDSAPDKALVRLADYKALSEPAKNKSAPSIALIHIDGMIVQSATQAKSSIGLIPSGMAAADEIVPAITDAMTDPAIQALVIRVNSPGGSPVASESILHALKKAQEKGKPVYVSMGPAAASGGYWISASADKIFAMPATLTGSIGVVGGKVSIQRLSEKVGINWEHINISDSPEIFSVTKPFSKTELIRMQGMLSNVYDQFIKRVSQGRNLTIAQVEEIAQGRVWSGADAKTAQLIDELGSLNDTLNFTAQTLNLQSKEDLNIITLPKAKTRLERFVELLENTGVAVSALKAFSSFADIVSDSTMMKSINSAVNTNPNLIQSNVDLKAY